MKLGENGEAFFVKETESDEVSTGVLCQTINHCIVFIAAKVHCVLRNVTYASMYVCMSPHEYHILKSELAYLKQSCHMHSATRA